MLQRLNLGRLRAIYRQQKAPRLAGLVGPARWPGLGVYV